MRVLIACTAAWLGAGALATAAAAFPGAAGDVAFVRDYPAGGASTSTIYVAEADGSSPRRLTNPGARTTDTQPTWSPDGTKILFARVTDGDGDLYVVGSDGTGLRRLTSGPEFDFWPAWSPDGARIAFSRGYDVWVARADGGEPRLVARGRAGPVAWMRDGRRLAVPRFFATAERRAIVLIDLDGKEERRLTPGPWDSYPDWAPDGDRLVYMCGEHACLLEPGKRPRVLVHFASYPTWLPDGERVAFARRVDVGPNGLSFQLFTVDVAGRRVRPLTRSPASDVLPDWQAVATEPCAGGWTWTGPWSWRALGACV